MEPYNDITPVSIVLLIDTNKDSQAEFVRQVVHNVTEGNVPAIEVHVAVKCMEEIVKAITSDAGYKAAVLAEAEKYGSSFAVHNAAVQIKEAGTRWDYSNTNDSILHELQEQADALAEQIKQRQKMLQTIPESGMADPATGQIIYKAVKSSTTTVSVTLK